MKKTFIGALALFLFFSAVSVTRCDAKLKINKQELLKVLEGASPLPTDQLDAPEDDVIAEEEAAIDEMVGAARGQ